MAIVRTTTKKNSVRRKEETQLIPEIGFFHRFLPPIGHSFYIHTNRVATLVGVANTISVLLLHFQSLEWRPPKKKTNPKKEKEESIVFQ